MRQRSCVSNINAGLRLNVLSIEKSAPKETGPWPGYGNVVSYIVRYVVEAMVTAL
jgi:hypothetical protein